MCVGSDPCRYVGNYGDADPLDISQWTRLGYAVPADARAWNEKTATCSNMFNGMLHRIGLLLYHTGWKYVRFLHFHRGLP